MATGDRPGRARVRPLDVAVLHDRSDPAVLPDLRQLRHRWGVPAVRSGLAGGRWWVAVASVRGRVRAVARAVPTPYPFPIDHHRSAAVRALGPDRRDEWLAGGIEVTEVLVDPVMRGRGLGTAVLAAIDTLARCGRTWAVLDEAVHGAVPAPFPRRGWHVVLDHGEPTRTGPVVVIGPRHPAVRTVPPAPVVPGAAGPWSPFTPHYGAGDDVPGRDGR